jgi:ERCC4-related helicase
LFLEKKLLVIPQKAQFEQQYNAVMLKNMGVTIIKKLKKKHHDKIEDWLNDKNIIKVNYRDNAEEIVNEITSQQSALNFIPLPARLSAFA